MEWVSEWVSERWIPQIQLKDDVNTKPIQAEHWKETGTRGVTLRTSAQMQCLSDIKQSLYTNKLNAVLRGSMSKMLGVYSWKQEVRNNTRLHGFWTKQGAEPSKQDCLLSLGSHKLYVRVHEIRYKQWKTLVGIPAYDVTDAQYGTILNSGEG